MAESLEREIRDLRALVHSERDPEGRGFAPLADALRRAGDLARALEVVREGVERLPQFATGHVISGWIHRARGDDAEAGRSFRRVLELDDENVSALRGLGFLLADGGAHEEALQVFRRLDELEPGDLEIQARLLELGRNAPVEAAEEEETRDDVVPIESLAPDDGGTVVDIESLAPGPPADPAGTTPAGPPASAGPDAERPVVDIRELAPDEPRPSATIRKAREERPGRTVMTVGRVGASGGEGPWTRTMAELYARQGLTERAMGVYRRLLEQNPGDEGLRARLLRLESAAEPEPAGPAAAPEGSEAAVPPSATEEEAHAEEDDAHLEDLARHMAAGPHLDDEPEGPFAWGGAPGSGEDGEDEEAYPDPAPAGPVSDYFRSLLSRRPAASGAELRGEAGIPAGPPGHGEGGPPSPGGS